MTTSGVILLGHLWPADAFDPVAGLPGAVLGAGIALVAALVTWGAERACGWCWRRLTRLARGRTDGAEGPAPTGSQN